MPSLLGHRPVSPQIIAYHQKLPINQNIPIFEEALEYECKESDLNKLGPHKTIENITNNKLEELSESLLDSKEAKNEPFSRAPLQELKKIIDSHLP